MKIGYSRRKIIVIAAALAGFVLIVSGVLLYFSDRIVKARIENALGKNFKIEKITLGFNRLVAYNADFSRDQRSSFHAKRIEVRVSFLSLLRKGYAISELAIEQPTLIVQIDAKGNIVNPVEAESQKEGQKEAALALPEIYLHSIIVSDGAVTIHDERTKGLGTAEVTGIQLTVENLSFPLKRSDSGFALRMNIKGKILSGILTCHGKINPVNRAGEITVDAANLEALGDGRGAIAKIQSLHAAASSKGHDQAGQRILFSSLVLTRPFIKVEADRDGQLVSPIPLESAESGKGQPKGKTNTSFIFNNVRITGGEILYLDGKVSRPPYPVRITDISLKADALPFPVADAWSTWDFSALMPGMKSTGKINGTGRTMSKSLDTNGKFTFRNLDITSFKPYLKQHDGTDVAGGTLDMDVDGTIRHKSIYGKAHAVIRNLRFASGGAMDQFLGVPRSLVIKFLETSKNELPIDFVMEGNLDDPKFSLQEDMIRRFAVSIGQKVGLTVIETPEKIIIEGGRVLKSIKKGLRDIFK